MVRSVGILAMRFNSNKIHSSKTHSFTKSIATKIPATVRCYRTAHSTGSLPVSACQPFPKKTCFVASFRVIIWELWSSNVLEFGTRKKRDPCKEFHQVTRAPEKLHSRVATSPIVASCERERFSVSRVTPKHCTWGAFWATWISPTKLEADASIFSCDLVWYNNPSRIEMCFGSESWSRLSKSSRDYSLQSKQNGLIFIKIEENGSLLSWHHLYLVSCANHLRPWLLFVSPYRVALSLLHILSLCALW